MKTFNPKFVPMAAVVAALSAPAWANGGSVVTNDTASFRLVMFGDAGTTKSINAGGNVSVLRGPAAASMGLNVNGGANASNIMCKWDELSNPNNPATRLVVAEMWTAGKEDMMPFGVTHNGEFFNFWWWQVGATNPVSFTNNSTVQLFSARI
ncbi:MAG: hypothetical protein L6Q35_15740, partial [Phycisphaerales bacterium]|nr:hypothetical protein [Phycisphaerales bacterium]